MNREMKIELLQSSNFSPVKDGKLTTFDCGKMMKDELVCSILIEYDGNKPNYNIYYGIKVVALNAKSNNDQDILSIIEHSWCKINEKLEKAFNDYWDNEYVVRRNINNYNEEEIAPFLNKEGEEFTVWPFWISLDDTHFINEAKNGVKLIIETLLSEGFCYYK